MGFTEHLAELLKITKIWTNTCSIKVKIYHIYGVLSFFWLKIANLRRFEGFSLRSQVTIDIIMKVWKVPTAQNWNSSSAEAVFDLKIPSLGFQTKQKRKVPRIFLDHSIENSSKSPLLAFEQNPGPKTSKPSECVATKSCAGGKALFPSLCLTGYS